MRRTVKHSIRQFEKHNKLRIRDYSSKVEDTLERGRRLDKYIGEDVFEDNVYEWVKICETDEDKELFLTLLENYDYFSEERFLYCINQIIEELLCRKINLSETVFIVFPSKKGIASGGEDVSVALKKLVNGSCTKEQIINDTGLASRKNKSTLEKASSIVFIDDVIGTGLTAFGNVRDSINCLKDKGFIDKSTRIIISAVCANEEAVNRTIDDLNNKCFKSIGIAAESIIVNDVEPCLTKTGLLGDDGKDTIYGYETKIDEEKETDDKECIGGFEKCELLLSFYYNTPNNTLSIFWRPTVSNNPLFIRNSYVKKRLKIDEIKQSRFKNHLRAYRGRILQK